MHKSLDEFEFRQDPASDSSAFLFYYSIFFIFAGNEVKYIMSQISVRGAHWPSG